MEGPLDVLVDPGGIRKAYLAEMKRFLHRTRELCKGSEIEYHQVSLKEPMDQVLLRFLYRVQHS
jgi:hypothetical protein